MNDLEKHLRDQRLAPPSVGLDRRMNDAFAAAGEPAPFRERRWFWAAALGLAGTAATYVFLLPHPAPAPPPEPPVRAIVSEVEAQGLMREWLLTPPSESLTPPKTIISVNQ